MSVHVYFISCKDMYMHIHIYKYSLDALPGHKTYSPPATGWISDCSDQVRLLNFFGVCLMNTICQLQSGGPAFLGTGCLLLKGDGLKHVVCLRFEPNWDLV